MADKKITKKLTMETLDKRQEKILALLHEEQRQAKERFPLVYALLATFGVACTFAGINKIIANIEFLNNNPIAAVIVGVGILLFTGAVYKKLG